MTIGFVSEPRTGTSHSIRGRLRLDSCSGASPGRIRLPRFPWIGRVSCSRYGLGRTANVFKGGGHPSTLFWPVFLPRGDVSGSLMSVGSDQTTSTRSSKRGLLAAGAVVLLPAALRTTSLHCHASQRPLLPLLGWQPGIRGNYRSHESQQRSSCELLGCVFFGAPLPQAN
jgi:hypothetical protein